MSCLKPRIRIPFDLEDNTVVTLDCTYYVKHQSWWRADRLVHNKAVFLPAEADPLRFMDDIQKYYPDAITVPCGICMHCRMAEAREWTQRMVAEAQSYKDKDGILQDVYFCTFTYEDSSLEWALRPIMYDGQVELVDYATTRFEHFQSWMKRFRAHLDYEYGLQGLRFFACTEYGDTYKRPHCHAILYGLPEYALLSQNFRHEKKYFRQGQWISRLLDDSWGKGYTTYCKANLATMSYTAGYVVKKLQKSSPLDESLMFYEYHEMDPITEVFRGNQRIARPSELYELERRWSSRKPGLGHDWYLSHQADLRSDQKDDIGLMNFPCRPARYFDQIFDRTDHEGYKDLKNFRAEKANGQRAALLKQHKNISLIHQLNYNAVTARFRGLNKRNKIDAS